MPHRDGKQQELTKSVFSFRELANDRQVYVFNELWVRDDEIKSDPTMDIMLTVGELPNSSLVTASRFQTIIFIVMIVISFIMS